MARKKKSNPYEDYGLQATGQGAPSDAVATSDNPYETYGQTQSTRQRDPKLVWDWDKPSKEEAARAVVEAKNFTPQQTEKPPERKRSFWERVGDKFEANSPEDKAKRQAQNQPELYKDQSEKGYSSIGNRVGDIFEANSPQDKAKRKSAGEEDIYQHQQALEAEAKNRNKNFNFTKEEVEARRDYYKRQGIDIEDAIKQKQTYDDFKTKYKGQSLSKLTREKNPDLEAAQGWEKVKDKVKGIEQDFSDYTASQTKEGTPQQINRNFQRGLVEQIVKAPSALRTMGAGAVDLVAPEGSRIDKFGQRQYDAGKQDRKNVDQMLIDQGVGANPQDNQFVANVSQGAGSLASSLAMAGVTGPSSVADNAVGWAVKAKQLLNPGVPGGVFGLNKAADVYIEAKDAGKSDAKAFGTALIGGATEGYLEKLGVDKFLGADGGLMKKFITRAATEGFQEFSQSFGGSVVESTYKSTDFSDAFIKALTEGGYGALVGGGGGLALSLAEDMQAKGVPPEEAKKASEAIAAKVSKVAEEELPQADGDQIVKELTGSDIPAGGITPDQATDEQLTQWGKLLQDEANAGDMAAKASLEQVMAEAQRRQSATPTGEVPPTTPDAGLPTDGDSIVKALQENGIPVPGQQAPDAGLPATGDEIVKELQGGQQDTGTKPPVVNPPNMTTTNAERDWDDNYGDKVGPMKTEIGTLERDMKQMSKEDKAKAQARIDELTPQIAQLENEWQDKWKHTAVGGEEPAKVRPIEPGESPIVRKGQMKPLTSNGVTAIKQGTYEPDINDQSPEHIRHGQAAATQLSEADVAELVKDKFRAYVERGDSINLGDVLTAKGRVPVLRSKSGVDYHIGRDRRTAVSEGMASPNAVARSPEELIAKIDQLNKAGQATGILRKGQLRSKKAAGLHQQSLRSEWEKGKLGTVKLRDDVLKNPQAYMTVLAHELSHAMEFAVNGTSGKTLELFGDLTKEEKSQITDELKAIVNNIEGKEVAEAKPEYFYKPTEMLARYVETILLEPSTLTDLAPLTTEKFQQAVIQHPQLGELMDAINGKIDEGFRNKTPSWWRDLRQIYQEHLGKRVGNIAYNAELVRRAKLQNWQQEVGKLVKQKFKGVKDPADLLFKTAEAIKQQDDDGNIEFGTRDFVRAESSAEIKELKANGYEFVRVLTDHTGKETALFAKQRYTEAEGQELFDSLSDKGKQLVRDFTATKENAKDMFNRDLIKDVFKIDAELEGWVHRGLREDRKGRMTLGGKKAQLREKTAGMKKQRTAEGGHMEDFRKQMEKALREAGDAEINNAFLAKQLARISKPIAKGADPDVGWVEVTADLKRGLKLPGEGGRDKVSIEKTDKWTGEDKNITFLKPEARYQVPAKLAEHYRNIRQVPQEITKTQKIMTGISKYWAINVLLHGGTVGTNFISGGIQYSAKIVNDFYVEVLSGNATLPQTRRNVAAMVQVLLPKGWAKAPDYVYGGHRSNYAGQFMTKGRAESFVEKAGDIGLKPFSLVESYWKKAILISEQGHKMETKTLKKEMIEFSKAEEDLIGIVNEQADLYAYDYDNVPMWLESWSRKGGLIKPFAKYPYKFAKMITNMASGAFDRTLSVQERSAKILTLATMVALSLALQDWRDKESETPAGTEKTPAGLDPRGRLFLWKNGGQEMFVRTAKYPFINITSIGKGIVKGDWDEASNVVTDQLGTLGPISKIILTGMGYTNKYEQYTPKDALIGQQLASFVPLFRIQNDIAHIVDQKPRKPDNFVEGFFGNFLPVGGSEETKSKLRGAPRTVKVPVEPETRKKGDTETIEKDLKLYGSDILLSALTGIYISRISPEDANQQQLREKRNSAEKKIEAYLTDGKTDEAEKVARENGLTIPDSTYKYYRRLREKRGQ